MFLIGVVSGVEIYGLKHNGRCGFEQPIDFMIKNNLTPADENILTEMDLMQSDMEERVRFYRQNIYVALGSEITIGGDRKTKCIGRRGGEVERYWAYSDISSWCERCVFVCYRVV